METRKAKRTINKSTPFTKEQDRLMFEHYPTMHFKELVELIGKSRKEITRRAYLLGIKKLIRGTSGGGKGHNDTFSPEEKEILIKHYSNTPSSELLKLIPGKTRIEISKKAHKMGLKKDAKFIKTKKEKVKLKKDVAKSTAKVNYKTEAPKRKPAVFKTKAVDPTQIIKVRVDSKTVLELKKGCDVDAAVRRYKDNQLRSFNSIFKG